MKTLAILLVVGALDLAVTTAATSAPPQSKSSAGSVKYYVDIEGDIAPLSQMDATLTFSKPVQLPKVTLPAGTYRFTAVGQSTIRVTSEDRKTVYTMFTTIAASRSHETNHAQLRLERVPNEDAPRLIALYPEGSSTGFQPVFPKIRTAPGAPIATSGTKPSDR